MTTTEARSIVESFNEDNHTEEEEFRCIEAMRFLIEKERSPRDMLCLGGHYYEKRQFDLALKYYEMAASFDYDPAYECLGYIWYYGRTGERDYKNAFECFSRLMEKGDFVATYKVADMYKNGYYVEKSYDRYVEIIESLYPQVKNLRNIYAPVPEVLTRLAAIRVEQGKKQDAVNLYLRAKELLAQRIKYSSFFGNLSIMKWLIDGLYELTGFDPDFFDLFDLFYLLRTPHKVTFYYGDSLQRLESVMEDGECVINFNGKWYRTREDFFGKAEVDGVRLTSVYDELYGLKVD